MIFDTINNLSKYKSIPNLDLIVNFIKDKNLSDLSEDEIEIKGRNLFVKALRYLPKPAEEKNFEIHKIYTDVQIIVKGVEKIEITNKENLKEEIEDKKNRKDFHFFTVSGPISEIIAKENNFVVFFPGEPHKPSCSYQKLNEPVLKIIFKTKASDKVRPPDYDSKKIIKNGPDMWMSEIRYVKDALLQLAKENEFLNILEWGSGNSTIYFSKFLKQRGIPFKWIAIENFVPWHEKVVNFITEQNLSENTAIILKNPIYDGNRDVQEMSDLGEYLNFPSTLGIKFNLIIIDGRKRKECLDKAAVILAKNGLVILHDAERKWYHEGFKHYLNGGEFVATNISPNSWGGVQKLWAGRLP